MTTDQLDMRIELQKGIERALVASMGPADAFRVAALIHDLCRATSADCIDAKLAHPPGYCPPVETAGEVKPITRRIEYDMADEIRRDLASGPDAPSPPESGELPDEATARADTLGKDSDESANILLAALGLPSSRARFMLVERHLEWAYQNGVRDERARASSLPEPAEGKGEAGHPDEIDADRLAREYAIAFRASGGAIRSQLWGDRGVADRNAWLWVYRLMRSEERARASTPAPASEDTQRPPRPNFERHDADQTAFDAGYALGLSEAAGSGAAWPTVEEWKSLECVVRHFAPIEAIEAFRKLNALAAGKGNHPAIPESSGEGPSEKSDEELEALEGSSVAHMRDEKGVPRGPVAKTQRRALYNAGRSDGRAEERKA